MNDKVVKVNGGRTHKKAIFSQKIHIFEMGMALMWL